MAELFLARATALHGFEKLVVLKRILPQHAESEDFIRMFLDEARLAATLHHPNIVQVYDIGEQDETFFFTMEYVQGQDLRKLVRAARKKSVPIPVEHVLHIVAGVAAGLNHAHQKNGRDGKPLGIVHRDVSPSNVLVTYEGGVKIVDFGIAKAATAQVNTIAGTLKGKIPYMSPEQCRGEAVDCRSDIFSIGTLLWEMTTGSRLFAGDNEFAILNRVAKGDVPPPTSVRPDYPPELEAIVMRALQPDPDQRYETALDLQIDLEDFSREARLPVSSARMARFMRDLFSEEIQKAAAQLAADSESEDVQTLPQPVLAPSSMAGAPAAEPNVEYTPSELRVHAALPTPGPVGSETGIVQHSGSYSRVPGQTRPAVAVAVFASLLGIGGATAVGYSMLGDDPTVDKESAEPRFEVVEVPAPLVEAEPEPEDEDPIVIDNEPGEVDPSAVGEVDAVPGAVVDSAGDPAGDPAAVPPVDSAGGDPADPDVAADSAGTPTTPPAPSTETKPKPPKHTPRPHRGGSKGSKGGSKGTPKPTATEPRPKDDKKKKPGAKYDPNSALPPGWK